MATLFFLGVMAAAGYYVFNQAVAGGRYVTVPNIVDLPLVDAYTVLVEQGLELGEKHEVFDSAKPKNYVIAQRPQAGKVVRAGHKVHPTVSVGPDLVKMPSLIGQTTSEAQAAVSRAGQFNPNPVVATMPHRASFDLVIGQDPPPGKAVPRGTVISLLVSSGSATGNLLMQDLTGMAWEEAQRVLTRSGLKPVCIRTDRPDAPFDVVVSQQPPAGTLVQRGDEVKFWVRTSAEIADAYREVKIAYTVPYSWFDREVRVDLVTPGSSPWTLFPQAKHYVDGKPPRFSGGETLPLSFSFRDQVTVEIYLDGKKVQSYYYKGDAEPVVTIHEERRSGEDNA